MTKRAAVYTRYSSSLQKETSIDDQIAMAERYCEREGWEIVEVFEDREMSGRHTRRPGFQALLEAVRNGEFDVVVIEAVDRLTRRVGDAVREFERFSYQNIELVSVQEGPQDFMRVLLLGLGAQMFSEKIADHTKRGMAGAVLRGRTHSRAYGIRQLASERGPNREIDPDTAPIVVRIFEEFASGRSATAIAKGLNADRFQPRTAARGVAPACVEIQTGGKGFCAIRLTSALSETSRHRIPIIRKQGNVRSSSRLKKL
jgi:DNA invertase Pin-like site-specific DNA recombinase